MIQEVKMSHEEKVKMYMKCTKKELIEMLIESNRVLEVHSVFNSARVMEGPVYLPEPAIIGPGSFKKHNPYFTKEKCP